MKFNYQVRTKAGEIQAGVVEASSREVALSLLQKHGYYVTYLEESKMPFYARKLEIMKGISQKDIVLFSRQLSMMFKSKVPLVEALRILASGTKNLPFQEKILNLSEEVEGGSSFSKALSRHPDVFSILYVAMIKAGETAGKLSESLIYLADHLEREYALKSKTMGALLYPSLVLVMAVLIIYLMINTVVPSLRDVIEETGSEIPAFTQIVLDGSEILRKYGLVFLGGFVVFLFLLFRYQKTEGGKKLIDKFLLKTPLIGPFLKILSLSRIAESLSTLLSGGLMITQAIELSANVAGNSTYQKALLSVRDEVRRGVPISSVLALYPDIFPPLFVQMTLVGEKTGNLAPSLMEVSRFYQGETERGIVQLLTVLEPILIIGLGGIVGGLIFSILMPLYETLSL